MQWAPTSEEDYSPVSRIMVRAKGNPGCFSMTRGRGRARGFIPRAFGGWSQMRPFVPFVSLQTTREPSFGHNKNIIDIFQCRHDIRNL